MLLNKTFKYQKLLFAAELIFCSSTGLASKKKSSLQNSLTELFALHFDSIQTEPNSKCDVKPKQAKRG